MGRLFSNIDNNLKKQLPFVVYRKPNLVEVSGLFLGSDEIFYTDSFTENGFVFAPFDSSKKAILFPKDEGVFIKEDIINIKVSQKNSSLFLFSQLDENKHITIVEKAIQSIKRNEFKKVVISRKETHTLENIEFIDVFKKLLQKYTTAFVYVWYHPKIGLWLGATPETLLNISKQNFTTMSLAGTQIVSDEPIIWGKKELEEQQLVTDFIENQLKDITNQLTIDKKETVKAGNLLHLKTKVAGELKPSSTIKTLIRKLHPTPAVCGLPREETKAFILKNEGYNRDFYTGFLGEINNKEASLFVNLRCMRLHKNNVTIYVGGGITKESNAEKEWVETQNKSYTMKSVLQ